MSQDLTPQPVEIGSARLKGLLSVPAEPRGLVIFAHGSGSSRHSPRNRHVAEGLHRQRFASLLMDLLTPDEERDRNNVFDIPLLAQRLAIATEWAASLPEVAALPVGYFGASTGAAAALVSASLPEARVAAIVSRGGRPDLAGATLASVRAPTLLIVGSLDTGVIELNRSALTHIQAPKELVIIRGARHLFEEGETLDEVITHAGRWFGLYLEKTRDA
ncbi:MAG TPA: dienelactone hydrolase family protein [Steroidobacteraceae bacterium]|jgi:putative phosphoribosyl transferase